MVELVYDPINSPDIEHNCPDDLVFPFSTCLGTIVRCDCGKFYKKIKVSSARTSRGYTSSRYKWQTVGFFERKFNKHVKDYLNEQKTETVPYRTRGGAMVVNYNVSPDYDPPFDPPIGHMPDEKDED